MYPTSTTSNKRSPFVVLGFVIITVLLAGITVGTYLIQRQNTIEKSRASDACSGIQNPSVTGPITIPAGCSVSGTKFSGTAPAGTTNDGGCVGFSQNGSSVTYTGPTTISLAPSCGKCEQIDLNGGYGTAKYGGDCKKNCGETCNSNNDCRNPSAAGIPTKCNLSTHLCESAVCTPGHTIPGANCSCSDLGQCGDACGPTAGNKVCDSTNSECGFIVAFNSCREDSPSGKTTQYCLPKRPQNGYSKKICTNISAYSLVKPGGSQTGLTRADVLEACKTVTTTATATATATTSPTDSPISARCVNIRFFDENWQELSTEDLESYKANDKIRIAVAGSASSGSFTKARFVINGAQTPETTLTRPGGSDFYHEFTFPEGQTSFTFKAELYHSALGWF